MIINGDAIKFAKEYEGKVFHAILCDPPYHLTSIVKRFGKKGAAPAKHGKDGAFTRASAGFMGKTWDGGDIAFQPETWEAFKRILHPGAFGMAFGGTRTAHRMATAIEDAGFIIHPMIFWVYASGFPKATRIKNNEVFEGHRYGAQAMKPAGEPIIVFQKPYEGKAVENIIETGAGALNIDGGRIGLHGDYKSVPNGRPSLTGLPDNYKKEDANKQDTKGRWPANFVQSHHPDCKCIGTQSDDYQINRFTDGAKPFGDGAGHEFDSEEVTNESEVWECIEGCAVRALNLQTGVLKSGTGAVKKATAKGHSGTVYGAESRPAGTPNIEYGDKGGASRFFHQSGWEIENADPFFYKAKANKGERNAGLENKNIHPTVKPIALAQHLATLLLPPPEYAPRKIFVPFSGVASEMIGAMLTGWEQVLGVELTEEYIPIAEARYKHWKKKNDEDRQQIKMF